MWANSLSTLYHFEKNKVSPYQPLFEYIIHNYAQICSLIDLYSDFSDEAISRQMSSKDKILSEFDLSMIGFVHNAKVHLSCIWKDSPWLSLFLDIFEELIEGKTVREMTYSLNVSTHTIQKCRFIVSNSLATSYQVALLKKSA